MVETRCQRHVQLEQALHLGHSFLREITAHSGREHAAPFTAALLLSLRWGMAGSMLAAEPREVESTMMLPTWVAMSVSSTCTVGGVARQRHRGVQLGKRVGSSTYSLSIFVSASNCFYLCGSTEKLRLLVSHSHEINPSWPCCRCHPSLCSTPPQQPLDALTLSFLFLVIHARTYLVCPQRIARTVEL